jgi:MoaA/NifB/PqqE/SkfB family radical SAM enzyme
MSAVPANAPAGTDAPLAPPLPRAAQVEPIGRCNLACRMCTVNERGDTVAALSLAHFEQLLDQMPGLQQLHLQGLGEPMLHAQFFEMVEIAVARGIRVSANTNLTLLTPRRAARCIDSGLASLSVSLDGASAAVYEAIRRKASFAKVLRNLGRLVDARDAAGSALEVRLVMVLMRSNLHELPALVRLAHAHRVPAILVQRLSSDLTQPDLPQRYIPIRDYVSSAELAPPDLGEAGRVFDAARDEAARLGVRLHLPRLAPRDAAERGARCDWPWSQIYLTAAGELLPCCMVATADRARWGNVFDTAGDSAVHTGDAPAEPVITADGALPAPPPNGLLAQWHSPAAQAFRAALSGPQPPAVCRSCALYDGNF